ncbi:uncharacterized protein LOC115998254 isoform X2 [Ipomoea triloba]|uniref:uncharacterized protein LOC115998254 isoform X2 n=1 Tax=Ipomoea triloba TaxID=35885 RepID=UPI00125CF2F3|nr:uncharacterized protein LOC115998254 isoform X2 [Ipomoea triloba]
MYALNLRPSIYEFPRSPNPRSLPQLRPLLHSSFPLLHPQILSPTRFTRIPITSSTTSFSNFPTDSPENGGDDSTLNHTTLPSGKQFLENASWIGLATITSKIMGLLREIVMASVFGIGPVAIAFRCKWSNPYYNDYNSKRSVKRSYFSIQVSSCSWYASKLSTFIIPSSATHNYDLTNNGATQGGSVFAALVFIFAEFIIHAYAPGLWTLVEGEATREIAIKQLKVMSSCIAVAGPIGLGYAFMSTKGKNVLPAIFPTFSSLILIASCIFYTFCGQGNAPYYGGVLLSFGAAFGLFLQWVTQALVLKGAWHINVPYLQIDTLASYDVSKFFSLLLPATFSSGLEHIASFTDLYFASRVPGAVAGLSYANLLVTAPLGLLSSTILLPLLPTFSKLAKSASWTDLAEKLRSAILLCMVVLLPILSTVSTLAEPIIRVLFERLAFNSSATSLVASLFICYSIGTPFFIVRELLVAVFYSLGDGQRPFLVSISAIALNAILDWFLVCRYFLGGQGLALSTSATAALSVVILILLLQKKLAGVFHYAELIYPALLLSICCLVSSLTTSITHDLLVQMLTSICRKRLGRVAEAFSICLASATGIISFFVPVILVYFSGFKMPGLSGLLGWLTNKPETVP